MNRNIPAILVLTWVIFIQNAHPQWVTNHDPVFMTSLPKPVLGAVYIDPNFGTSVRRVTDAVAQGAGSTVPQYSKRQVWNCNDSLMLLLNPGPGYFSLYDAQTYQFIRNLDDPAVTGEDVFWHPANPNVIIYSGDSNLYAYNVSNDQRSILHTFHDYYYFNDKGEGNLTNNGQYYAFVGQDYNFGTGQTIYKDFVIYDLFNDQVTALKHLPQDSISDIDWFSVSSSGNYVVADWGDEITGRYHGIEVYDHNLNFLWQKPLGTGHSDLGKDVNGDEIMVLQFYEADSDLYRIYKYRLQDGQRTLLLTLSPLFDLHISCRNTQNYGGWCFVSTFDYVGLLSNDSINWLPFENEVFALKLDGSGDVRRIAHHYSRRFSPVTPDPVNSNYWAEPHATISTNANKIAWGSNWSQDMAGPDGMDVYVCDFSNFLGTSDPITDRKGNRLYIFPNPTTGQFILRSADPNHLSGIISICDITGKEIRHFAWNGDEVTLDISGLPNGIYLLKALTDKTEERVLKLIKY